MNAVPPPEPGAWKEIASALTKLITVSIKPLAVVSNSVTERLEIVLTRKPRLYVNFHPLTANWCLAHAGDKRIMQVGFTADFSHDDPNQTVILIDAYPKGTRSWHPFQDHIGVCPGELVTPERQVHCMSVPVVGEEGENWTGRIVFVDQWQRKYKTNKFEFTWVGASIQRRS